jgi:hypothetical protein
MGLVADPTPKERVQRSTVLCVEPLDQRWSWVRHGGLESPKYIEPRSGSLVTLSVQVTPIAQRQAMRVSKFATRELYTL